MNWKVPYINLPRQYENIMPQVIEAVERVLRSGRFILGDEVELFEENMRSFLGVNYVIGVNSGTDALRLCLESLPQCGEVITVSHTAVATVAAIAKSGNRPILIDVGDDFNMDFNQIERAINIHTVAIVPVHLNGRICNMQPILDIAEANNLTVIEDAAQALGAKYNGKSAGTYGLAGCFSLHPLKVLSAAGDGGFIATNNDWLAERIRLLRNHGRHKEDMLILGHNSRLDSIQAAILNVKLKYLPQWLERRREVANLYHSELSELGQIKLPPPPIDPRDDIDSRYDIYSSYVIRAERRYLLYGYLRNKGIEVFINWPTPLHNQPNISVGCWVPMDNTEGLSRDVLSLPISAEITDAEVGFVIDTIKVFYIGRVVHAV